MIDLSLGTMGSMILWLRNLCVELLQCQSLNHRKTRV